MIQLLWQYGNIQEDYNAAKIASPNAVSNGAKIAKVQFKIQP